MLSGVARLAPLFYLADTSRLASLELENTDVGVGRQEKKKKKSKIAFLSRCHISVLFFWFSINLKKE